MTPTANRTQASTAWEQFTTDEIGVLQVRAARDAELALTPSSDAERLVMSRLFDPPTTSNLSELFAQPTTSGLSRIVRELAELLDGAILGADRYRSGAATDQYLYEDQSPIEVPDDWFAELRQTKVLVDKDFELPWADG